VDSLQSLLQRNKNWAHTVTSQDPNFFSNLSKQQSPEYLWIGCSDSRVPANQIVGLPPGEIFVHRNVGNVVVHTDFNCLSVIQFAVAVLGVRHIIVCGHYGCGGVQAALGNSQLGLIDNWLRHIKDVANRYDEELTGITDQKDRLNRLCELNVIEQVNNICHTTVVQEAWRARQELSVHGWIYGIQDGIIQDLGVCIDNLESIDPIYRMATRQKKGK